MGILVGLAALFFGGTFIVGAFRIWFTSGCDFAVFHFAAHLVQTECYPSGQSVPDGITAGWAGFFSLLIGFLIIFLGLGAAAATSR